MLIFNTSKRRYCGLCFCSFVGFKRCPMLSCFINVIFNRFLISYWTYCVVIERKEILKKDYEKPDGIFSVTFVANEFSGILLYPSIFSNMHKRSV